MPRDYKIYLEDILEAAARIRDYSFPLNAGQHPQAGRAETMKKFLIVIEETGTGYSAYSPDLPGCVSTGRTREEVERNMREGIEFHLEGMGLEGMEVPDPHTYSAYIEISA